MSPGACSLLFGNVIEIVNRSITLVNFDFKQSDLHATGSTATHPVHAAIYSTGEWGSSTFYKRKKSSYVLLLSLSAIY